MNKYWILGAIAAIVIIGAGFFLMQGNFNFATMGNTSLRTLLASGQSQKCTFNNGESSGTIYVGGGKMRGDFTARSGEGGAQSHMVISNDMVYVWIEGQPMGYRMSFEDLTPGEGSNNTSQIDADAKVATDCTSWQASESSFALPENVTFNELPSAAALQQSLPATSDMAPSGSGEAEAGAEASGDYYAQQCRACSMITDSEARMQCEATFDCP